MFSGVMTAMVTPFDQNGRFDSQIMSQLIDFQIEEGVDGIVPCGSTGESATLNHQEHQEVIAFTIKMAKGRTRVIAGTGSNSTEEAIALTQFAEKAGADAALLTTPYYNKPTQEGLFTHYQKIHEKCRIPLILYNIPGRTGVNMLPETVARLASLERIVAIKEASGSLVQMMEIIRLCGDQINLLSGDDGLTLPVLAIGGKGVISVTSNIFPKALQILVDSFNRGDIQKAREVHYQYLPLHDTMFLETNPIPVKAALFLMGKCPNTLRLPLTPLSDKYLEKMKKVLHEYHLIPSGSSEG
ncbi:MAG: 4-hydroxy-tetrahydrodipicolinate synthase [Nitrospirae bacterium]|nr:4-hydroxy-tetrahydrodipicolinate synthase [Nitrospirota bacterium]MBI3594855.1 4-hydroxy-tetrahydrodipicolinate synthase [Nitrospirota bacterium]